MRRVLFAIAVVPLLVGLLPITAFAGSEGAEGNHETYHWVVTVSMPATAMAADGSTVTMKGNGMLKAGPNGFANGGGSFVMKNASGAPVASGTFSASDILGFVSYGTTTLPQFPAGATGGEAKLRVTLTGTSGVFTGVLTIICVVKGSNPPAGKDEGITLVLGQGGDFTKEAGGNTVFQDIS